MARVVCIHGIGQAQRGASYQRERWLSLLARCTREGNASALQSMVEVPYYADRTSTDSSLGASETMNWSPEEVDFIVAAAADTLDAVEDNDSQIYDTLGPPGVIPPILLRIMARIDRRWGVGKGLLALSFLREVYAYFTTDRERINSIVSNAIGSDTRLIIGHSLGSVVAVELLDVWKDSVEYLVTLGSPLAWPSIQKYMPSFPVAIPRNVIWSNFYDPWDVVTAGRGLAPLAFDRRVANSRTDPHSLGEYLKNPDVSARLHDLMDTITS